MFRRRKLSPAEQISQGLVRFGQNLTRSKTLTESTLADANTRVQQLMEALVPAVPLIGKQYRLGTGAQEVPVQGLFLPKVFEQDVLLLPDGRATGMDFYHPVTLQELVLRGFSDQDKVEAAITGVERLKKYFSQAEEESNRRSTTMGNLQRRLELVGKLSKTPS